MDIEPNTPTNIVVEHPSFSSPLSSSPPCTANEEDALISRISSLLTKHLLSCPSSSGATTTTTGPMPTRHENETTSNLSDSAISLSTGGLTPAAHLRALTNPSSTSITSNDFDRLLQRIRTAVDNRLSLEINSNNRLQLTKKLEQDLPTSPIQGTTRHRRQQLLALHAVSCQETHTDDYDAEHSALANSKGKLDLAIKSQSFDASNLSKKFSSSLQF